MEKVMVFHPNKYKNWKPFHQTAREAAAAFGSIDNEDNSGFYYRRPIVEGGVLTHFVGPFSTQALAEADIRIGSEGWSK